MMNDLIVVLIRLIKSPNILIFLLILRLRSRLSSRTKVARPLVMSSRSGELSRPLKLATLIEENLALVNPPTSIVLVWSSIVWFDAVGLLSAFCQFILLLFFQAFLFQYLKHLLIFASYFLLLLHNLGCYLFF